MSWTAFNFFVYDPEKDDFSKTTFNIKQALNNNWDHVKALIEEVRNSFSGVASESYVDNAVDGLATEDYVDGLFESKAPAYTAATLAAANWVEDTYSFESAYPAASYDIEIQPNNTCSAEQMESYAGAMLTGSITSNIVKALGDVPTVDIPIILKAVAK